MEFLETIATNRLILRKPCLNDAAIIVSTWGSDREAIKYLPWVPLETLERGEEFVKRCKLEWDQALAARWLITLADNATPIGSISVKFNGAHRAELFYILAREHWGHGYVTEAVQAIVKPTLSQKLVFRLWAYCDIDNIASIRVLEKCGFMREGVLRRWSIHPALSEEPRDCFSYSIIKEFS